MKALSTRNLFNAAAVLLIGSKLVPYVRKQMAARRAGIGGMPETRRINDAAMRHDDVTEASMESFPASDSPSFTPGSMGAT